MTEKQLQTIVALMAGMQTSIVHLSNLLTTTSSLSHEDVAASFDSTADAVPNDAMNQQVIQIVLHQVARGIRSSQTGDEWDSLITRLLK